MFRDFETNQICWKIVIPAALSSLTFFANQTQWNTKGFLHESFRHWETKQFRRIILILSTLPLVNKLFRYRKVSKHSTKDSPTKNFGTDRQGFYRKSWHNLLKVETFLILEISDTLLCSLRKVLVMWDNNFAIEGRDITLLILMFFNTRNFLKHRRIPLRNELVLWGKTIWRKIVILVSFLSLKIFRYQNVCRTQKGCSAKL